MLEKIVQSISTKCDFSYQFLLQFLLIGFILSCDSPTDANKFVIKGKYNGDSDLKVTLAYTDIEENIIIDTIPVINGRFTVKGFIQDISRATIIYREPGTTNDRGIFFFLEPQETLIDLKSGILEDVKISGGKAQREFEYLSGLDKPIYDRLDKLGLVRDTILNQLKKNKDSAVLLEKREEIAREWRKKLDSIRTIRLNFAADNPNSLLSGYLIGLHYFRTLPIDSVEFYNQRFGQNVKNSLYGKMLKRGMLERKTKSGIGDKAPSFALKNLEGKTVNLHDFKDQYLLIDFWASTCVPCRESNPKLKKIYEKFHPKGLELVGISSDSDINRWKKAISKDGLSSWHHLLLGKERSSIYIKYNILEIPTYILIDKEGSIIGRFKGDANKQLNLTGLEKKLDSLFVNI